MFSYFSRYFISHIFNAKTRQRLLLLAIVGLFLSSFALLVLQSTMGGLQRNRIERSKAIFGDATIVLPKSNIGLQNEVLEFSKETGLDFSVEYEIELLLQNGSYLSPVIVHAISKDHFRPGFLKGAKFNGALVPIELAYKTRLSEMDELKLISPSHTDVFFGEIPRMALTFVERVIATDDTEVDSMHLWVRLPLIQNVIKKRDVNTIRFYGKFNTESLRKKLDEKFSSDIIYQTWEEKNQNLVWALNLETVVMTFLFTGMTLLVSLCITSGLMIFFNNIKLDLASFWIQGASKKSILSFTGRTIHGISFVAIISGLGFGLVFLELFDLFGPEIMPDVFVDRKIPVYVSFRAISLSVLIPFVISWFFAEFSLYQFKKENNYLDYIRSLGR